MTLAPLGTCIVAHFVADTCTSFGLHCHVKWYIGPSPEHYCCYKILFTDMLTKSDVLKVNFFLHQVPFPKSAPKITCSRLQRICYTCSNHLIHLHHPIHSLLDHQYSMPSQKPQNSWAVPLILPQTHSPSNDSFSLHLQGWHHQW